MIAGAFYPYYFHPGHADEEMAIRGVRGLNYLNTVVIHGVPNEQGPLYESQVKKRLYDMISSDQMRVYFDCTRYELLFNWRNPFIF